MTEGTIRTTYAHADQKFLFSGFGTVCLQAATPELKDLFGMTYFLKVISNFSNQFDDTGEPKTKSITLMRINISWKSIEANKIRGNNSEEI